jgi:hypothetical protein
LRIPFLKSPSLASFSVHAKHVSAPDLTTVPSLPILCDLPLLPAESIQVYRGGVLFDVQLVFLRAAP